MKAIVKKTQLDQGETQSPAFSFVFVQEDGSPLLRSNPYRSKDSAYKGIRAVKKNCKTDHRYIINKGNEGQHSFQIKSGNGVAIVDSVRFSSEQEMQETVKRIKQHLPECEIDFQRVPRSH